MSQEAGNPQDKNAQDDEGTAWHKGTNSRSVKPVFPGKFQRGLQPPSAVRNRLIMAVSTTSFLILCVSGSYFGIAFPAMSARDAALSDKKKAEVDRGTAFQDRKAAVEARGLAEEAKQAAEQKAAEAVAKMNAAEQKAAEAGAKERVAAKSAAEAEAKQHSAEQGAAEASIAKDKAQGETQSVKAKDRELEELIVHSDFRTADDQRKAIALLEEVQTSPKLDSDEKAPGQLRLARLYLQEAVQEKQESAKIVAVNKSLSWAKSAGHLAMARGDDRTALLCAEITAAAYEIVGARTQARKMLEWGLNKARTNAQRAIFQMAQARLALEPANTSSSIGHASLPNDQFISALRMAEEATYSADSSAAHYTLGLIYLRHAQSLAAISSDKASGAIESLERSIVAFKRALDATANSSDEPTFLSDSVLNLAARDYGVAAKLLRALTESDPVKVYRETADRHEKAEDDLALAMAQLATSVGFARPLPLAIERSADPAKMKVWVSGLADASARVVDQRDQYRLAEAHWASIVLSLAPAIQFKAPSLPSIQSRLANPELIDHWVTSLSTAIVQLVSQRDENRLLADRLSQTLRQVNDRQRPLVALDENWSPLGVRLAALLGVPWSLPGRVENVPSATIKENVARLETALVQIAVKKSSPAFAYHEAALQAFADGLDSYNHGGSAAAVTSLSRAIKLDPQDARLFYFRALAYLQSGSLGSLELALDNMRAGAALELTDPQQAHRVNRVLERIQGPLRTWIEAHRRLGSIQDVPRAEPIKTISAAAN